MANKAYHTIDYDAINCIFWRVASLICRTEQKTERVIKKTKNKEQKTKCSEEAVQ